MKINGFWDFTSRELVNNVGFLGYGTTTLRNVGDYLPFYVARHARRRTSSTTPLWDPVGRRNVFDIFTGHRMINLAKERRWCHVCTRRILVWNKRLPIPRPSEQLLRRKRGGGLPSLWVHVVCSQIHTYLVRRMLVETCFYRADTTSISCNICTL